MFLKAIDLFPEALHYVLALFVLAQSCPTLCTFVACSLPGSSVHGIFSARILVFFFGASLMAQTVKNLPAMQETLLQSLGWEVIEVSTLLGPQSQVQESCLFWMQALS